MSRVPELAALFEQLAADEAGELLEEVRHEGRSVARRRLVECYADALVRAVGDGVVDGPTSTAVGPHSAGCYVYAVTAGSGASAATAETGVTPGGQVDVVAVDGLAAVVNDVDIAAVRRGCDEADVSDSGWLATAVRAHDRVVVAAFRSAPSVPFRFGVVYPDRAAVASMLRDHADELRAELDRLAGRAEWNVKVFADLACLDGEQSEADDMTAAVS